MSPSIGIIISVLTLVVLIRMIADNRQIIASRRLRLHVSQYVKKHFRPHVTVIIELRRNADSIIPLLDHLYDIKDDRVEILVLIKQTAGKNAQPKLAYYRKKFARKNLRLLKHRSGMTLESLLVSHVTSELVMTLDAHDRLSPNFFPKARLAFLDGNVSVLMPRKLYTIDESITSALRASIVRWRQLSNELASPYLNLQQLTPGNVFNRLDVINEPDEMPATYSSQIYVLSAHQPTLPAARTYYVQWLHTILSLSWLVLITFAIYLAAVRSDTMPLFWTLVSYILIYIGTQIDMKPYARSERLSFILLSPLAIMLDTWLVLVQLFRPLTGKKSRQNTRHLLEWMR